MKEPDREPETTTAMAQPRQPRIVSDGRMLNHEQQAGRRCVYCPVTFGRLDPVPAAAEVEGVLFLAAHPACIRDHTARAHT